MIGLYDTRISRCWLRNTAAADTLLHIIYRSCWFIACSSYCYSPRKLDLIYFTFERGHARRAPPFEIARRVKFNRVVLDKNRDDARSFVAISVIVNGNSKFFMGNMKKKSSKRNFNDYTSLLSNSCWLFTDQ